MNEPYFQVGEEVILVSVKHPHVNGDYVVEDILPPNQTVDPYNSNHLITKDGTAGYKLEGLDDVGNSVWWTQNSLRKKHKPSTQSFSNLITNIEPIEA